MYTAYAEVLARKDTSLRGTLLHGAGILALEKPLLILLAFAAVLLPSSVLIFFWSLRRTKVTGTPTHR